MKKIDLQKVKGVIIHCSATQKDANFTVQRCKKFHVEERGWSDIGYHFYITQDGVVHNGRSLEYMGAHCKGKNDSHLGICLEGGIDKKGKPENNFSDKQWTSLKGLITYLKLITIPNATEIAWHNQFANRACPSFDVPEWCKENKISYES